MRRSQAILRMPVDMVDAVMILDDGDRADVLLLLPPSEDLVRFIGEGKPFVPVMREAHACLIARAAISAIGVAKRRAPAAIEGLPTESQKVKVKLRGGAELEGLLTFVEPFSEHRTAEHLNADSPVLLLEVGTLVYLIPKTSVVQVVEL